MRVEVSSESSFFLNSLKSISQNGSFRWQKFGPFNRLTEENKFNYIHTGASHRHESVKARPPALSWLPESMRSGLGPEASHGRKMMHREMERVKGW